MSHKINLGRSFADEVLHAPASARDVHYPDLHISECEDEKLLDIPDEGTAQIKFKVTRRHHTEENGDKKKRRSCSLTLEIHSIEIESKPVKKKTHWEMFNG